MDCSLGQVTWVCRRGCDASLGLPCSEDEGPALPIHTGAEQKGSRHVLRVGNNGAVVTGLQSASLP